MKKWGSSVNAAGHRERICRAGRTQACDDRRKILERQIAFVKIGRAVRLPIEEAQRLIRDGFRPVLHV